jgi:hypothetical protein
MHGTLACTTAHGVQMAYSRITGTAATASLLRAKGASAVNRLIGLLLLGHFSAEGFAGSRRAAPRCRIALRVFTPSGMPAVKIRWR